MTHITVDEYFLKYGETYASELTLELRQNAAELLGKVNILLTCVKAAGIGLDLIPLRNRMVCFTSGWRPKKINAKTPGAARFSLHMSAKAIDISDPDGLIDEWCISNTKVLRELGLYLEHPSATKGWCHLQSVPPKSGRLIFYP